MNGRIFALLAAVALVAAGCESDNAAGPGRVMSADVDVNTVRVGRGLATMTVDSVDVEAETFSITFVLPDGDSVTFTDADEWNWFGDVIGPMDGKVLQGWNGDGDAVEVLVGFAFDYDVEGVANRAQAIDDSLFVLARVDPDPEPEDTDLGFDTYMVTGDETATLPGGEAFYSHGALGASFYANGALLGFADGGVDVWAKFSDSTVDIWLDGEGAIWGYLLAGFDLPIDGSSYGGSIDGIAGYEGCDCGDGIVMTGDLLGAFFGDAAEATAGVFGAEGADIEIVGAFAAYDDVYGL